MLGDKTVEKSNSKRLLLGSFTKNFVWISCVLVARSLLRPCPRNLRIYGILMSGGKKVFIHDSIVFIPPRDDIEDNAFRDIPFRVIIVFFGK